MTRVTLAWAVAALTLVACNENTAPGNDRESHLDSPEPAAEMAAAGEALSGVATGLLHPQIMTDADLAAVRAPQSACRFRFTAVGFPVLVYGDRAMIKLNGKLVPLPAVSEGRFAVDSLIVDVHALDDGDEPGQAFPAAMVLRLPGKKHELGYHGFAECGG